MGRLSPVKVSSSNANEDELVLEADGLEDSAGICISGELVNDAWGLRGSDIGGRGQGWGSVVRLVFI